MLKLFDNIGGGQGLGSSDFQQWKKADTGESQAMSQEVVLYQEEEHRKLRVVELVSEGTRTKWDLLKEEAHIA